MRNGDRSIAGKSTEVKMAVASIATVRLEFLGMLWSYVWRTETKINVLYVWVRQSGENSECLAWAVS